MKNSLNNLFNFTDPNSFYNLPITWRKIICLFITIYGFYYTNNFIIG